MRATLLKSGIPAKDVKVYGSQIMVVTWSRDAADKWASLIARFAKVRGPVQSWDRNVKNRNTVLRPTSHEVWLVGGHMQ